MIDRRIDLDRGIYDRLSADGRSPDRALLHEVQFRLNPMVTHWGFPADPMVFGSNRMDLYIWLADGSDLDFAQGNSASDLPAQ